MSLSKIKDALEYIDAHPDEKMSREIIAKRFHFSPYYFHRLFSTVAGKALAAYVRDRRLMCACVSLATTDRSVLDIAIDSGFSGAQSFSRTFKRAFGVAPSEYRKQGFAPDVVTVDELIKKFTNRLKGGIYVNPNIIKRGALTIAGVSGDGNETGAVWETFMQLLKEKPLIGHEFENGYEIRLYDGDRCTVHIGYAVPDGQMVQDGYSLFHLPASQYASFDVYPINGYDSENSAMDEWLSANPQGYKERLLDSDTHYCVEYYDERFHGNDADSIVEIWVPIEK